MGVIIDMDKKEFMSLLSAQLYGLSADEQQRILDYYNELILDGMESGKGESEVIEGFGNVYMLGQSIRMQSAPQAESVPAPAAPPQQAATNKMPGLLKALISVMFILFIGLPVLLPLIIVYFSLFIVLGSFVLAAFTVALSGVVCCVLFIHPASFATALFQFGCGLILIGLGIAFTIAFSYLIKLLAALTKYLCRLTDKGIRKWGAL